MTDSIKKIDLTNTEGLTVADIYNLPHTIEAVIVTQEQAESLINQFKSVLDINTPTTLNLRGIEIEIAPTERD